MVKKIYTNYPTIRYIKIERFIYYYRNFGTIWNKEKLKLNCNIAYILYITADLIIALLSKIAVLFFFIVSNFTGVWLLPEPTVCISVMFLFVVSVEHCLIPAMFFVLSYCLKAQACVQWTLKNYLWCSVSVLWICSGTEGSYGWFLLLNFDYFRLRSHSLAYVITTKSNLIYINTKQCERSL